MNEDAVKALLLGTSSLCERNVSVLRAFQAVSIFNFSFDENFYYSLPDSLYLFKTLTPNQIWHEWQAWALHSKKPSLGLELLNNVGWVELFPQLYNLQGIPQDEVNHPEGDVWTHTLLAVDEARKIADRDDVFGEDRIVLMLSALTHDFGKPLTTITENSKWVAPNHEFEGMYPARKFLESIGAPENIIKKVVLLVKYHMFHNNLTKNAVEKMVFDLKPASFHTLVKLMEADNSARPPHPKGIPESTKTLIRIFNSLQKKIIPFITPDVIVELAKKHEIPSVYKRKSFHHQIISDELFEVQQNNLVSNVEEAVDYVKKLLSPLNSEDFNVLNRLTDLTMEERSKLARYELTEKEILSLSEEELFRLISSVYES